MTTAVRIAHRGGNHLIRITEKPKGDQSGGQEAIVGELAVQGDETVVHVHAGNTFVIEEVDAPANQMDPRDPNPAAS